MNKPKINIFIIILIAFSSCGAKQNGIKSIELPKEEKTNNQVKDKDSSKAGKYFSESILEMNVGIKSISSSELNSLNYNQLFSQEGVIDIVVYYDKRKNQFNEPTKFEDFLLFVINYDNSENAKKAFKQIKLDAELCNSNKQFEKNEKLSNRLELLKLGEKYGGLITYNENQVFSLVENCEKIPLNKSWLELEYMFTDLLKNKNGYVEVLKAGCNEGRYYGGRRKASS